MLALSVALFGRVLSLSRFPWVVNSSFSFEHLLQSSAVLGEFPKPHIFIKTRQQPPDRSPSSRQSWYHTTSAMKSLSVDRYYKGRVMLGVGLTSSNFITAVLRHIHLKRDTFALEKSQFRNTTNENTSGSVVQQVKYFLYYRSSRLNKLMSPKKKNTGMLGRPYTPTRILCPSGRRECSGVEAVAAVNSFF